MLGYSFARPDGSRAARDRAGTSLTKGNRTRAAQMLGINVRTLRRKLNGGGDTDRDDTEVRGRVA